MRCPRLVPQHRTLSAVQSPPAPNVVAEFRRSVLAMRRIVAAGPVAMALAIALAIALPIPVVGATSVAAQTPAPPLTPPAPAAPTTPARVQAPSARAGVHPVVLRAIVPSALTPYSLYVASESGSIVTHIEVSSVGWRMIRQVTVGATPSDTVGPHNVAGSPDGRSTLPDQDPDCLATSVGAAPSDSVIRLACDHTAAVQLRDATTRELRGRLPTEAGAYNVKASPDGRLVVVVTNKMAQNVRIFDAHSYQELARVPTSKKTPHGIGFSPDDRYAFVSCESTGATPGAVDAIDLKSLQRVASISIPRPTPASP